MKLLVCLTAVFVAAAFVSPAIADKPPKDPGHSGNSGQSGNAAPGGSGGNSGNSGSSGNSGDPGKPSSPGSSGNSGDPGKPSSPGNSGNSGDPGKPSSPGNSAAHRSPTRERPAPGATPAAKAKAYGRWCQNQSKHYVAGQPDTQFRLCLTAMAKLATAVTNAPWTACRPLSRKPSSDQTGSPFSRCVIAGTRLLDELHKPSSPGNSAAHRSPTRERPAPDATPAAKAKAYGRWCQNQSKHYVAGQPDTQFRLCLTAMAKLATAVTNAPWTACRPLSRKPISGQTGSPFSRCVIAGTRLLNELHRQ